MMENFTNIQINILFGQSILNGVNDSGYLKGTNIYNIFELDML